MDKLHNISNVRFEDGDILLNVDGKEHRVNCASQSRKLAESPDEVKSHYKISPSGYGIHWPDIDEDLSIAGLLGNNVSEKHDSLIPVNY